MRSLLANMSYLSSAKLFVPLAIILNIVQEADFSLAVLKFVYQKDMSEYCRRRVMPSVFLGRHVMESQSQILHFSQLEVPYSCFVSLRTESGSNIILVLQLAGADEESAGNGKCFAAKSQVTVHELGETFGGYWGPLPEVVLPDGKPTPRHLYTRPTTTATTPSTTEEPAEETTTPVMLDLTSSSQKKPKKDYIRVEIPLVNVSGPFANDPDFFSKIENNDRLQDTMRRPGVTYHTSLLPVVQFSLANMPPHNRRVGDQTRESESPEPRYDLQFNPAALTEDDDATVDLQFLMGSTTPIRKIGKKFRYNANRLRKLRKNKGKLFQPVIFKKSTVYPFDVYSTSNLKKVTPFTRKTTTDKKTTKSWQYIEDLLKHLKNTTLKGYTTEKLEDFKYNNISKLLKKIAGEPHNLSAYLDPKSWTFESSKKSTTTQKQEISIRPSVLSKTSTVPSKKNLTNPSPTEIITIPMTREIMTESSSKLTSTIFIDQALKTTKHSSLSSINSSQTENATGRKIPYSQETPSGDIGTDHTGEVRFVHANNQVDRSMTPDLSVELGYKTNIFPVRENNESSVNNNGSGETKSISTGTMVDHESWQNVVQVAPAITSILNKTGSAATTQRPAHTRSMRKSTRPKRSIHPIAIKDARPHSLTTLQEVATTSESIYQFSDIQDFAQLVELEDDNIYGRIALRYLGKYVGRLLFDLCDYNETNGRHVFLFNSSRIVIAINNFTMKRMTVVATPARTLMHAEAHCANDHIECQVSGARVCIDGMSACDGVPNCGAYDIYDEDRLRCGAFSGLQHGVILAALVFLAVLLTLLYTVHYWLKRCVPRVSKAFFIYTNGSENVLYLDSIMRSPNDFDNESRLVFTSNIFDAEDLSLDIGLDIQRKKESFLKKIRSLFTFGRSKVFQSITRPDSIDIGIGPLSPYDPRKQQPAHSFAELELSKMMSRHTVDRGVQTGESLEMALKMESNVETSPKVFPNQRKRGSTDSPRRSHNSELSLLKFVRNAKQTDTQTREPERPHPSRRTSSRQHAMRDVASGVERELQTTFYDNSKFMQEDDSFVVMADVHGDPKFSKKRLRFKESTTAIRAEDEEKADEKKNRSSNHDEPVESDQEHGGREFMRFFGGKSKRTKKKSHPSIR